MTGAKLARRGVNWPMLILALISLAIARLATLHWRMLRRLQKISFGSDGCTRYRSIMSPEDIIPVFEGVFVTSSLERRKHMMISIGAEATEDGSLFAIWNVESPGKEPKTARLELEGFPKEYRFRPHGIHYRIETGELFVVNHAYSDGGERIDVFKVSEAFPQDPLPPKHPSLLESEVGADGTGGRDASEPEGERAAEAEVVNLDFAEVASATPAGEVEDEPHHGTTSGVKGEGAPGGSVVGKVVDDEDAERKGGASAREEIASEQVYCANEGDGRGPGGADQGSKNGDDKETRASESEENENCGAGEAAAPGGDSQGVSDAAASDGDPQSNQEEQAAKTRASARSRGLSRGSTPIKLTYSFSVEHEIIDKNYGALNDLVLASDDELYVTQYLAWPEPLHGAAMPDSIVEHLQVYASMAVQLFLIGLTPVIHCTGIRGPDVACERLVKGPGVVYNGIALSPNKERLLVADTGTMQLFVFNRSLDTGELTLRQKVELPGAPDNLELDVYRAARGEEAYTVGLVNAWNFLEYAKSMRFAKDPSDGDHIKMAGGMASVVFDQVTGKYTSNLDMWQDGSLLSISSAASTASGTRLLGSAVEEGFLVCRPPAYPPGNEEQDGCPGWVSPPDPEEGKD